MLIGEFEVKLTDKKRVAIPKKFRQEIKGELIITRGYEGSLIILDESRWEKLISAIEVKPFLNRSVRDTKRFLIGGATEISLDTQGRFIVPDNLLRYGKIVNDTVFVGVMDWIEVWAKTAWDEKIKDLTNSADEIAERLLS